MAEESQDGQEKTEDPSQRKIEKSAEDGKVLTSKEMFVFTSMFAAFFVNVCDTIFCTNCRWVTGPVFFISQGLMTC